MVQGFVQPVENRLHITIVVSVLVPICKLHRTHSPTPSTMSARIFWWGKSIGEVAVADPNRPQVQRSRYLEGVAGEGEGGLGVCVEVAVHRQEGFVR